MKNNRVRMKGQAITLVLCGKARMQTKFDFLNRIANVAKRPTGKEYFKLARGQSNDIR